MSEPLRSPKLRPWHLDRAAVVYVRQSTPQQVTDHKESTARQYALADRAVALGWTRDRVTTIDDDLGKSGQSIEGRPGSQRLLAEVALDRVGLILGLEMSRLARSCKDWHHLLELCGRYRVLLADADGVYDPTDTKLLCRNPTPRPGASGCVRRRGAGFPSSGWPTCEPAGRYRGAACAG